MKLTREILNQRIRSIVAFCPKTSTNPLFLSVRISVEKQVVTLCSLAPETYAETHYIDTALDMGDTLDVALLPELLLAGIENGDNIIDVSLKDNTVHIKRPRGSTRIQTSALEGTYIDFPVMDDARHTFSLPKTMVHDAMRRANALLATSPDMAWYARCIGLILDKNVLIVGATDGFAAISERIPTDYDIPKRLTVGVRPILIDAINMMSEDSFSITIDTRHILVQDDSTKIYVSQENGQYPDFDSVLIKAFDSNAIFDGAEAQNMLKRIKIFSQITDENPIVYLEFPENALNMKSKDSEAGATEEAIDAVHENRRNYDIALSVKYLRIGLACATDFDSKVKLSHAANGKMVMVSSSLYDKFDMLIAPIGRH